MQGTYQVVDKNESQDGDEWVYLLGIEYTGPVTGGASRRLEAEIRVAKEVVEQDLPEIVIGGFMGTDMFMSLVTPRIEDDIADIESGAWDPWSETHVNG